MSDQPQATTMLYRAGEKVNPAAWNLKLDTLVVADDEVDAAKADGWQTAAEITAPAKADPKPKPAAKPAE